MDFKSGFKSTVTGQRILLAAKTAVAVGIAWVLAPLMPGVVNEYPYYAPLGVLVSMYPTFMGSLRTAFQTLLGVLLGIVLAAAVLLLGAPNIITISVAVGAGVLLGGVPRLGAGRDYVPVATLLVLIIGGSSRAEVFSLGYGLQMGLGVVVGLVVNGTIFPPLALDAAQAQIRRARKVLADQLKDAAAALTEQWPPDHEEWASRGRLLDDVVAEVRGAVHEAAESQRANPRARRRSRNALLAGSHEDLAVLENVSFYVRDLSEVLASAIWEGPLQLRLPPELSSPVADSLSAVAEILLTWDEGDPLEPVFAAAHESLDHLNQAIAASPPSQTASVAPGAAVALDLRRLLQALESRLSLRAENP
ncbi:aromatic acid exporter family protein [Specibacter sp. NPDC057265]|uniref:aromatic acid exporter family protein n=1 Tax=Specibacter sp. NPDC057265 TaxID=3346075 RepID=UPI00363764A4